MRKAVVAAALVVAGIAAFRHWRNAGSEDPPPYDQPREAAAYDLLKRVPPGQAFDAERYLRAMESMRRMPVWSSSRRQRAVKPAGAREAAYGGDWENLGPGNVAGRISALAIHPREPNIIYAGAVNGGVWKTEDAGQSWRPLSDLMPNISVNTLAMDPGNPDVLYAGTGQWWSGSGVRGLGVFKTTDAGATWRRLESTAVGTAFYYVNKIVVSPNDGNRVYAAVWGGVMRSLDGGETWARVVAQTAPRNGCQDIVIRADQPTDYLFAACGAYEQQAILFRTTDGASNRAWDNVFTEPAMARTYLAIAPSSPSTIYAIAASYAEGDARHGLHAVFRSDFNGDPGSWRAQVRGDDPRVANTVLLSNANGAMAPECRGSATRTPGNQGFHAIVLAVDPVNPERVWAGGVDLYRSDDGGRNWGAASYWWATRTLPQYLHADHKALAFHPNYDGVSNRVLFSANDGGVARTDDATAPVATSDTGPCRAANSELTWTSLNHRLSVTQFYHGAVYRGLRGLVGGTQDTGTVRGFASDGPERWTEIFGGDGGFVAIDPRNENTLYAETINLSIRKSVNGGASFALVTRGITEASANFLFIAPFLLDPNDPDRLWIGGRTLWRTVDGAANWRAASTPIASGNISAFGAAKGAPSSFVFGTSTGLVFRTPDPLGADGATAWRSSRPRDGYVSSLTYEPGNPDVLYATVSTFDTAAARGHVFVSRDGGTSWTGIDGSGATGIPDIPAHSLAIDPRDTRTLYLGTDLGIFVSNDGGANWLREETAFPNTLVETLLIEEESRTLVAFTRGRGAWKVKLP